MHDTIELFTEAGVRRLADAVKEAATADAVIPIIESLARTPENTLTADWSFTGERPDLGAMLKASAKFSDLARALYTWIGAMKPDEAADHRLWSYLSCVTFQDFTAERWPLSDRNLGSRFDARWIVTSPNRDRLVRNSISRMWWAAHLVHDPGMTRHLSAERSDPFAYLDVISLREDTFLGIMDRDLAGCPDVLFAILDHFERTGGLASEDYARRLLKEVVLISGYAELGSLDFDEITERIEGVASRILAA
ncbi:DUF6339 family protein [Agromyces sp. ZXT2-3]|uniref:DUF6339 family protein n=1 Tax=Agromyces sp. ZXT2-3 TaxID=3461152 RepID=UPI004055350D